MRTIIVLASLGLALSACAADPSVQRQAALNCQAVGISEKDPQFATCTKALSQQHIEDRLAQTYHDALTAVPTDRRLAHQDVY